MSRDTHFLMSKREKVCLSILKKLIESTMTEDPGHLLPDIHCAELVRRAVNMTDQMLIELKVKGETIAKEGRC